MSSPVQRRAESLIIQYPQNYISAGWLPRVKPVTTRYRCWADRTRDVLYFIPPLFYSIFCHYSFLSLLLLITSVRFEVSKGWESCLISVLPEIQCVSHQRCLISICCIELQWNPGAYDSHLSSRSIWVEMTRKFFGFFFFLVPQVLPFSREIYKPSCIGFQNFPEVFWDSNVKRDNPLCKTCLTWNHCAQGLKWKVVYFCTVCPSEKCPSIEVWLSKQLYP